MGIGGHWLCWATGHAQAVYPADECVLDRATRNFRSENYFAVDHGAN